ncbi:MAG: hypothetical protein GWP19_09115, partial [Planctomycetia bacterium]|nr:hypothetical protein [Planctomycetia bacterium]
FYHPSHLVFATTPFPLLWRTLRYLFQNLGFLYTDDFFSQDDYKTLNIFNVNNAVEAEFYVDGNETKTRNVVNNVDIANHLPDMDTANFIRTIQAFFNIFFHTSSTNIKVIDRLEMIKNTSYNDITDKITGDYKKTITGYSANGVSFQILKDDNDLNVKDFEDLNQHPSPEHVNEELYTPRSNEVIYEILDRHYKKFANQSEVLGSGSFDIWRWFNFPVTFSKVGEPEIYVKQAPWLIGEQEFELTNLPTPAPDQIIGRTSAATKPYNTPKIRQPGNSFVNSTENNFELRLMYYAGVQETLLNDRDLTGNLINQPVGDANLNDKEISARWSYENRWKEFIEWYKEVAKVEYEQDIQFSASEIKNFDYSKKYLIDGNSYFIKSFSVQFLRNEIKPAKCLMIKSE